MKISTNYLDSYQFVLFYFRGFQNQKLRFYFSLTGDRCQLPDNYIGRCTDLERCPAAIRALRRNIRPQTCGFIRDQPFVCCPLRRKPNPNGGIITPPVWTPPPTPNFNTVPFISTTSPTTTAASPGKISAQSKLIFFIFCYYLLLILPAFREGFVTFTQNLVAVSGFQNLRFLLKFPSLFIKTYLQPKFT